MESAIRLPPRHGRPPLVSTRGRVEQVTQTAPVGLQRSLLTLAARLPGVLLGPSALCVPGTCAYLLSPALARGPAEVFLDGTEFGHAHPFYDGSQHLVLPPALADEVVATGWGVHAEPDGSVLVYGPLDDEQLQTVWQLVLAAYHRAASGPLEDADREGTP
ncbi:hypothetical protein [Streptomyces sp. NPDC001380]|uniref:luciferase domain-containing protein n=1 Tax=Streptomyces sp. NPDC001380 TaxID=3364566 RepID=UPI0036C8E4D1